MMPSGMRYSLFFESSRSSLRRCPPMARRCLKKPLSSVMRFWQSIPQMTCFFSFASQSGTQNRVGFRYPHSSNLQ